MSTINVSLVYVPLVCDCIHCALECLLLNHHISVVLVLADSCLAFLHREFYSLAVLLRFKDFKISYLLQMRLNFHYIEYNVNSIYTIYVCKDLISYCLIQLCVAIYLFSKKEDEIRQV